MIEKYFFRTNKDAILDKWAQLSKEVCPAAGDKSLKTIRNHLPQLLEAFYDAIDEKVAARPTELSKIHGRQRFSFVDYTLSQVLTEYSLLKQVLFNELNGASELDFDDFFFIEKFFDSAANIAATEFVRLREEELKRYASELQAINTDLERFAGIAAHDLRAPASTIVGYAELLQEQNLDSEARPAVDTIHRTAKRIISLVEQLLLYAKIGKSQYSAKIVSLRQAVSGATENLNAQIAEANINVHVGDLPSIHGDQLLLLQLFQNLISNSIKFRSPDRKLCIDISSHAVPGYNIVTVRDNGIGFDPLLTEEIFEPFKRGSNIKKIAGSGLGLATVKKVMDLHGGSISAEGILNQGAVFSLQFPKLREEPKGLHDESQTHLI